jgi:hypothetical protein
MGIIQNIPNIESQTGNLFNYEGILYEFGSHQEQETNFPQPQEYQVKS